MNKTCTNCGKPIPRGKWCSDKCRMAYRRAFTGKEAPVFKDAIKETTKIENEWFNSATTRTQAEIEAHYTLESFPMLARYYSANGGGSGAISPYRQTDPRHKAYTLK